MNLCEPARPPPRQPSKEAHKRHGERPKPQTTNGRRCRIDLLTEADPSRQIGPLVWYEDQPSFVFVSPVRHALCIALFAIACTTSRSAVVATSGKIETSSSRAVQEEVQIKRADGPETITTTVEEFSAVGRSLTELSPAPKDRAPAASTAAATAGATLPQTLILVKRTVTVDQRGPSTEELVRIAKLQEAEHGTLREEGRSETHSSTRWGPPWWVWAGLAVAGCIAAWLAWKLKPPFLSFLWKLLP